MAKKRRISNIDEIREKVKTAKFNKEIILSVCEKVVGVEKFLESHITRLDEPMLLQRRHELYFKRLKIVLDSVGIEIKFEEVK